MTERHDLLRAENLSVSFPFYGGRIDAIRNFSLRIAPGKVTALVGESGSGKSVFGRTIMDIEAASAQIGGRVFFNDPAGSGQAVDLLALPHDGRQIRAIRGNRIGMIFQEPMVSFSPLHTIGNQIEEALKTHTILSPAERYERVIEMLGLVGFSKAKMVYGMYPFELSGGMRQRAMIAMALICRPALLIADEPTTALDVTIQAQILKLLKDLQSRFDMAILLITHDLGVVANLADEVVVVYRGEVMEAGPVEDIFRAPEHPYLKGLIAAVPHFDIKPGERLKPLRNIPVDSGSLLAKKSAARIGAAGKRSDILLSVRGITKTFTARRSGFFGLGTPERTIAVNDVGFDIMRGETLGLVGESGCGKTTLSKILMRGLSADSGSIIFNDADGPVDVLAAEGAELKNLRRKIQMVFQDPVSSLSPRMTVRNIIGEPLQIHEKGDPAKRTKIIEALTGAIGLDRSALSRYPHSFSGGQRQRIGIARALALGPELLICDEPVSALDVSIQAQILNLLKDLKAELGLTYLFISHNLAVVNYMADRVAVMYAGRIVEIGPVEKIMKSPVHPYTRKLLAAVPYPDLDRPLDYATVGNALKRPKWDAPFDDEDQPDSLVHADLGGGHLVLARRSVDARELLP